MTRRISDTKPVLEFIDIATKFVFLIENRDKKTQIQFIQDVFIALPQLCLCGMRLPDIKKLSNYEPPDISHDQWNNLFQSLEYKIKDYNLYTHVFDPYDENDREPIFHSLSDDLADIYRDIKPGLLVWIKVTAVERLKIIWDWKFSFEDHWGQHAVNALRAIYFLLYHHIEDKYGDYIGLREYK